MENPFLITVEKYKARKKTLETRLIELDKLVHSKQNIIMSLNLNEKATKTADLGRFIDNMGVDIRSILTEMEHRHSELETLTNILEKYIKAKETWDSLNNEMWKPIT